jgi:hypothetical protein
MSNKFLASVAAAMIVFTPASALAKGILLQYSNKVGEQVKFKMVMDAGASEFSGSQTPSRTTLRSEMVVSQQVLAAKDGIARVRTRVDSGSIRADGQALPLPAVGHELLADMKPSGEIVQASDFGGLDLKSMQVVFPDKELAVNDSWAVTIAPTPAIPIALTVTYKIAGLEKLGGEECVKITASVSSDKKLLANGLALDLKSEGEMFFAHRLGRMLKNEMRSRSSLVQLAAGSEKVITRISNHMKMESLP